MSDRVVTLEAGRRQAARLDLRNGRVELNHGAGGRATTDLIDGLFRPAFSNPLLDQGDDAAVFSLEQNGGGRLAMTTDSFVISPLFFPGGNIGSLAVHGTVNDLAMGGAEPLYLTCGFIIEEGFPLKDLEQVVTAMAAAAREAGVLICTGDTKVVERGKGDGLFINTTGIGQVRPEVDLRAGRVAPGQRILVSGTIGDHGTAILSLRNGLEFETVLESDSAALNGLVAALLDAVGPKVVMLRDPTRGGVAATLNEIASASRLGMALEEAALPIRPEVQGACELLGLDALNVANEGKLLAIVDADAAESALAALRSHPLGADAALIGEVCEDPLGLVRLRTTIGGERVVDWIQGEQLPRIC
ncbi:MAG: hydrogenase expression/formation protein HypE [Pseudomonadota bacterium]